MKLYKLLLPTLYCLHLAAENIPKNIVISRDLITVDGCAKLSDLIFPNIKINGQIDAHNCQFDTLDGNGFLRLINSRIKNKMVCHGELKLRDSFCATIFAVTKLIVLENTHIDELFIEELVVKNSATKPPKIILKGNSSIGKVTFTKMAGSIVMKDVCAQVGSVINGTVLPQSPKDQTA